MICLSINLDVKDKAELNVKVNERLDSNEDLAHENTNKSSSKHNSMYWTRSEQDEQECKASFNKIPLVFNDRKEKSNIKRWRPR